MDAFDTERFIVEIENRPALWATSSVQYSNRNLKKRCWEEVVDIFGGNELTIQGKKDLGKFCVILYLINAIILPWQCTNIYKIFCKFVTSC